MATFPIAAKASYGYSESGKSKKIVETEMDYGPPKRRLRGSLGVRKISATYMIDTAALGAFQAWFDTQISGGLETFNWTDPSNSVRAVRFVASDPYSFSAHGPDRWELKVSLEEWS